MTSWRCALVVTALSGVAACTRGAANQRKPDPLHHLEVRRGVVTYNGSVLELTGLVSDWVEILGEPAPQDAEEHPCWTTLGICAPAPGGVLLGKVEVALAPVVINYDMPEVAGFPGTFFVEGAHVHHDSTLNQLNAERDPEAPRFIIPFLEHMIRSHPGKGERPWLSVEFQTAITNPTNAKHMVVEIADYPREGEDYAWDVARDEKLEQVKAAKRQLSAEPAVAAPNEPASEGK